MTAALFALLPVFLVIVTGWLLRRSKFITLDQWFGIDRLCYFVLFPAFFFKEIATANFAAFPVFGIAAAMALAILTMSALLVLTARPVSSALAMNGPQFSSFFQGVTRWHTFVAFALVPIYFGQSMLALAALAAAVMTPLLNVVCVWVLARFASTSTLSLTQTVKALYTNPFLISTLAGLTVNLAGVTLPAPLVQVLDIIAKGALGLALLSVGAGLQLSAFGSSVKPIAAATLLKLLAMPALVWVMLELFGVTGTPAAVAILCNAVPTGSGAYLMARQMGGDATLMANILTVEIMCAALTIPLIVYLVG